MLGINHPEVGPYRSSTVRVLLSLLVLAFLVNTVMAWLSIRDYNLFNEWLADGTDHEIRVDFDREAGATCGGWARFRLPGA
jgi:hypothetical protein